MYDIINIYIYTSRERDIHILRLYIYYIYICVYIYMTLYIHIYRERGRQRDIHIYTHIYIYIHMFAVSNSRSKRYLGVRARSTLQGSIVKSLIRAVGEEAKMAGVPLEIRMAAAKNVSIRLDVVVIQKRLGRRKSVSSNKAKRACFDSL